jgi:hypothetical protein
MKFLSTGLPSVLLSLISVGAIAAGEPPFAGGKWIDLTHDFSPQTLYWPTAENFALESEFHGRTPKGYFYAANRYRASEHGGTHIDAPAHFAEGLTARSSRFLSINSSALRLWWTCPRKQQPTSITAS